MPSGTPWSDSTAVELPRPSVPTDAASPSWLESAQAEVPAASPWSDSTSVEPLGSGAPEPTAIDSPAVQPDWMTKTLVRAPAAPSTGAPLPRTATGAYPAARPSSPIPTKTQAFGSYASSPSPIPTKTQTFGSVAVARGVPGPSDAEKTVMGRSPSSTTAPKGGLLGRLDRMSAAESSATTVPVPAVPRRMSFDPPEPTATAPALTATEHPAPGPRSFDSRSAPELTRTAPLEPSASEAFDADAQDLPRDTAAALAPINDAEAPEPAADKPIKPVRRTLPATPKTTQPFPIKTALLVGVPLAVVLLGGAGLWLWVRQPGKPTPPDVQELPLPPAPPVVVAPPPPPPVPVPVPEVVKPPPPVVPMIAGKPIVLEYDTGAEAAEVPGAPAATVARAREAFKKGNARLAAGDKKGALKLFKASLKSYPAYVGAYRGLGRALAATGDKKNAIKTLKYYVKVVPEAEDVGAINTLIEKLGKKPPGRRK